MKEMSLLFVFDNAKHLDKSEFNDYDNVSFSLI